MITPDKEENIAAHVCAECAADNSVSIEGHCPHNLLAPNDALLKAKIADRYELVTIIGFGGWSTVYRGKDHSLNRHVAIKVLHQHHSLDQQKLQRFKREAESAGALNHPNVASIYDVGALDDGRPFIVMEHIDGKTLAALLKNGRRFELSEFIRAFVQIADALQAAHAAGLIHRDLKPSNIMITGSGCAKILDFGIAKLVLGEDYSLTNSNELVGTPSYMSPEQCLGSGIDARSDIYSLGCVMYEAASGQKAFVCDSVVSCIRKQMQEMPARINMFVNADERIPIALEATIYRCLEKNAGKRFQSMASLSEALRNCDKEPSWWQGLLFSVSLLPTIGRANVAISICALVILLALLAVVYPSLRRSTQKATNLLLGRSARTASKSLLSENSQTTNSPTAVTENKTTTGGSATSSGRADHPIASVPTSTIALANARSIHFPEDHAVGLLNIVEVDEDGKPGNQRFVDARGNIDLPPRAIAKIAYVLPKDAYDMEFAAKLAPDDLQNLNLIGSRISAKGIREIAKLKGLQTLSLFSATVPDKALWRLNIPALRDLDLGHTAISNNVLNQIAMGASRLERISLNGTPVTDAGLASLTKLSHLSGLKLADMPNITDSCLDALSESPSILSLDFGADNITNAGAKTLVKFSHLKMLNLDRTKIDDSAMEYIAQIPTLYDLNVAHTAITDRAIPAMSKMKTLRRLNIGATKISPTGVARLKAALKNCSIED